MKIYEAIKEIIENPAKTFRATQKPYTLKISSTGGVSVLKHLGKETRSNTLDITGEHVLLEWEETRKPITAVEALKQTKKIRPLGHTNFEEVTEWLLKLCEVENRNLLAVMWEIE